MYEFCVCVGNIIIIMVSFTRYTYTTKETGIYTILIIMYIRLPACMLNIRDFTVTMIGILS